MITEAMINAALDAFFRGTLGPNASSMERMRAALEAAERASWQPIETAPTSRMTDTVDLFAGTRFVDCWYHNGWRRHGPMGVIWVVDKPTHWRPLPEPPVGQSEPPPKI